MDPVGPWSYAYNRLTGVQAPSGSTSSSGDFHHHLALAAANAIGASSSNSANNTLSAHHASSGLAVHPSAATTQLLLQSGFSSNFLSSSQPSSTPANIAYETVFSPFLQAAAASHSNPKPAHYNNLQTTTLPRARAEVYQQQSSPSPSQHQQITNLTQQTSQQSPQNTRRWHWLLKNLANNFLNHLFSQCLSRTTESYQSSTSSVNSSSSGYYEQSVSTPSTISSGTPESSFSSFGILPHETSVPSSVNGSSNASSSKASNYGNLNQGFNVVRNSSAQQQILQQPQQQVHQLQNSRSKWVALFFQWNIKYILKWTFCLYFSCSNANSTLNSSQTIVQQSTSNGQKFYYQFPSAATSSLQSNVPTNAVSNNDNVKSSNNVNIVSNSEFWTIFALTDMPILR